VRLTISYLVVLLGLLSVPQFASAQSGLFSEVEDTVDETTDTVAGEEESDNTSPEPSSETKEEKSTDTDSSSEQEETSLTDEVTEDVDETIEDTKDPVDSTSTNVEDTAKNVAETSTSDSVETVDSTTETVKKTVDETTKVVNRVTETVKDEVDETTKTVKHVTTSPNDTVNKIVDEAAEKVQDSTSGEEVTEPALDKNPKKELPSALIPTKEPRTKVVQKDAHDQTSSDRAQSLKETKQDSQQPNTPAPIPNKEAVVPNPSPSMQQSESQQNVNGSVQVHAIASKPTDLNQSVMNVLHGKASFFFTQWMNAPPSEPPQISSFLPNV